MGVEFENSPHSEKSHEVSMSRPSKRSGTAKTFHSESNSRGAKNLPLCFVCSSPECRHNLINCKKFMSSLTMDKQQCVVSLCTILFEIAKVHQSVERMHLIAVSSKPAHFMNVLMQKILGLQKLRIVSRHRSKNQRLIKLTKVT